MALAYGDYIDAPPAVRVAALVGLVALALSSVRLMDMLTVRAEESTKDRAQRQKQIQVRPPPSRRVLLLHVAKQSTSCIGPPDEAELLSNNIRLPEGD